MTKNEPDAYPNEIKSRKQVIDDMNEEERVEKADSCSRLEAERFAIAKALHMHLTEKVHSQFTRDVSEKDIEGMI